MLIGTIRPTDTTTQEVEGESLAEIAATLRAQAPAGYELTDAPVRMIKGATTMVATGTYARRDGTREIEADDMPTLRGKVPDGYALISVRAL